MSRPVPLQHPLIRGFGSVSPTRSPRWRLARRVLAGALVAMIGVAVVGYVRFARRRDRAYDPRLERIESVRRAPTDATAIARGDHLAHTFAGCASCHGDDLGGRVMEESPVVRIVAPNLTPGEGSAVVDYTDEDWLRAIDHGVGRKGRSLVVMPTTELSTFADSDLAAVIAYMRTVGRVHRRLASSSVSPLGAVVLGLTGAPFFSAEKLAHDGAPAKAAHPMATPPPAGPTRPYGEYLTNICRGCHGPELRGGIVIHPGAPPSADLSPRAMSAWTFPEFERALREGKKRDGHPVDHTMPWSMTRGVTDDEMRALWLAMRGD